MTVGSVLDRFNSRYTVAESGCWEWFGRLDKDGYGRIWLDGRYALAHRAGYALLVAPVPSDLELDHLCRVRNCVNPDHLEPVSTQVNQLRGYGVSGINARKIYCDHGHGFTSGNTYVTPDGRRQCRACRRAASRRYHQKQKAVA